MSVIAERRARAWLERGGLRPTQQRLILAKLLVGNNKDCHVTAEALFEKANESGKISLATIYNTLHAFCTSGLMQQITVDAHRSYFDTRVDEHPHFYWEDGTLTDAPAQGVKFTDLPRPPQGTEIAKVDVVIRLRKI